MRTFAVICALAVTETPAAGQTNQLPPTLDCIEVVHAEADDALKAYSSKSGRFAVTFARKTDGDYTMVGNLGTTDLVTMRGNGFVQLLERTPAGTLNLTTIMTEPEGGRFRAIHSRHPIIFGQLVPSQYVLSCVPR